MWYFSHFHAHWDMYSARAGFGGEHALQSEQLAGCATRSKPFGHAEHRWQRAFGIYSFVYAVRQARSQSVPFQKLFHHTSDPQLSHLASCVSAHVRTCLYPVQSVHSSQRASIRAVPFTLNRLAGRVGVYKTLPLEDEQVSRIWMSRPHPSLERLESDS